MFLKKYAAKGFSQHFGNHFHGGDVEEQYFAFLNTFTNEVITNLDMFGPRVVFGVFGEGFRAFVVHVERDSGFRADI